MVAHQQPTIRVLTAAQGWQDRFATLVPFRPGHQRPGDGATDRYPSGHEHHDLIHPQRPDAFRPRCQTSACDQPPRHIADDRTTRRSSGDDHPSDPDPLRTGSTAVPDATPDPPRSTQLGGAVRQAL